MNGLHSALHQLSHTVFCSCYVGSCLSAHNMTAAIGKKQDEPICVHDNRTLFVQINSTLHRVQHRGGETKTWSGSCPGQSRHPSSTTHASCTSFLQHSANCLSIHFVLDQSLLLLTDKRTTSKQQQRPTGRVKGEEPLLRLIRERTSSRIIRPEQHNNEHSSGSSALSL